MSGGRWTGGRFEVWRGVRSNRRSFGFAQGRVSTLLRMTGLSCGRAAERQLQIPPAAERHPTNEDLSAGTPLESARPRDDTGFFCGGWTLRGIGMRGSRLFENGRPAWE
jgi:hypothetical protein